MPRVPLFQHSTPPAFLVPKPLIQTQGLCVSEHYSIIPTFHYSLAQTWFMRLVGSCYGLGPAYLLHGITQCRRTRAGHVSGINQNAIRITVNSKGYRNSETLTSTFERYSNIKHSFLSFVHLTSYVCPLYLILTPIVLNV